MSIVFSGIENEGEGIGSCVQVQNQKEESFSRNNLGWRRDQLLFQGKLP